jgi:hypothetical protein
MAPAFSTLLEGRVVMDQVEGAALPAQVAVHESGLGEVPLDGPADLPELAGAAFASPRQQGEDADDGGEESNGRRSFMWLEACSCSTQ